MSSRFVWAIEDIELEELEALGGPGSGNWGHGGRPGEVGGSSSEPTARYVGEVVASVDKRLREFERYEPYISGETPEERVWLQAVKQEAESIQTELQHATSSELAGLLERAQRLDKQVRSNPHRARTSHFEWVYAEERALGGPGSGNWGHAGRPGEVGGSAPGEGGLESKPSPVSVEQIAKIHELKAQGVGNAAIAKRMGWHYSEGKRVQRVIDSYNPDGTPKGGAPQPQPQPQPEPKPEPQPQPQPEPTPTPTPVFSSDPIIAKAQEKLSEIDRIRQELRGQHIRVTTYGISTNPTTSQGRRNIDTIHTSLLATQQARADLVAAGIRPPGIRVNFGPHRDGERVYASASGRTVIINTANPNTWSSTSSLHAAMQRDSYTGWHPAGSKGSDVIVHEIGHLMHEHLTGEHYKGGTFEERGTYWRWKGEPSPASAWHVSRYAKENKLEFVAETFSGLVRGNRYPEEVMAAYRALHGPAPKRGWK